MRALGACLLAVALIWFGARLAADRSQAAVLRSDPDIILATPGLRAAAMARGATVYRQYCAACHGADGRGDHDLGVPDLTDAEPLYGEGRVADIEDIARHGIRSADKHGWNLASMPAFASPHPYKAEPLPTLTPAQIESLTQYILAFTGQATNMAAVHEGDVLYHDMAGCYDCHGPDARGDHAIGAPSLRGRAWLYGHGTHDDIARSLAEGRAGSSPAFGRVLGAAPLLDVAVYVASMRQQPGLQSAGAHRRESALP